MIEHYYPDLKEGQQDWRWCHEYARRVVAGEIVAGKHIINACKRHIADLERDDLYFDVKAAKSIVLWFKFIPITDGKDVGKPTVLAPWQIWLVCSLMAWKVKATKLRKYKYAYVQVGRKNGKSTLAGGLTLYIMYKSGYFRPRAFSVATKKDQAKELWSAAHTMIDLSPRLRTIFEARANDILLPSLRGEFKPLASDSNTLDGKNPLVVNLDECHAIKDRNLYGVMVSAFGAQPEPLMLTITTAGTVLDGICTQLNKMGKDVLDPDTNFDYDSYFFAIYEIDYMDGDDWNDESTWEKANPGMPMGIPSMSYLRDRKKEADQSAEEKANFLTKHLNLFVSGVDKWLDIHEVRENKRPNMKIEDYYGSSCSVGLDRARVSDLTSMCITIPNSEYGATNFWRHLLPKATYNRTVGYLKQQYVKAVEEGNLRLVDTPTIRENQIKDEIRWVCDKFDVDMIGYDPYHMREIAEDMGEDGEGYPMVAVSQGTGNMSEPTKKIEGLIKEEKYEYNDVMFEFACTCAIAKITDMNNIKIVRENDRTDKIDPLISGIIAMSCATLQEPPEENVYESRGFVYL